MAGQGEAGVGPGATATLTEALGTGGWPKGAQKTGNNGKVFELGLVMAGAISAGAYTAGVIDFLIEALDEFEKMKADPTYDGPRHSVMIPVMAGASAGGMTAAIAALQFFHEMRHMRPGMHPPATEDDKAWNRLYSSWVTDIDMTHLLKQTDLDRLESPASSKTGAVVKSVLCCDVLDDIVERAFVFNGRKNRPWVGGRGGQPLEIVLTATNVGGIPYRFDLKGVSSSSSAYGMIDHGDRLSFVVELGVDGKRTFTPHVDVSTLASRATAERLVPEPETDLELYCRSALATGAYPLGLSPRVVWRHGWSYQNDNKFVVRVEGGASKAVPPVFTALAGRHRFVSLDGGMVDNEPLEAVRRFLADRNPRFDAAGVKLERNARDGDQSDRAVVLIDPFPNIVEDPPSDVDGDKTFGLLSTLSTMIPLLTDQARFKPEELTLAHDRSVFSRFNITPSRDAKNDAARRFPIASGALGGFSGFLNQSFRHHDYMLGRRNAQAFLKWHLILPETNKEIFDPGIGPRWLVEGQKDAAGKYLRPQELDPIDHRYKLVPITVGAEPTVRAYPIIPLSEALQAEIVIGEADMPYSVSPIGVALEMKDLFAARFERLTRLVMERELDDYMGGVLSIAWVRRKVAGAVASMAAKKFKRMVTEALCDIRAAFER
jgi:predicted acylesterase/phospholipase RssA